MVLIDHPTKLEIQRQVTQNICFLFSHAAKILNDDEQEDSGDGSASGDWDVHDLDCEFISKVV